MAIRWSEDEDKILKDNYSSMNCVELQKILPNRSIDAIRKRAKMFNLNRLNMWTESEEKILKDLYPSIGSGVSKFIHRHSKNSCTDKANRMGLKHYPEKWTKDEDTILIKNYPNMGKDVYKVIPGRSITACVDRARVLKLKTNVRKRNEYSWTQEEDKILKKFYPIMGPDVCFKLPKRTRCACAKRARNLGLRMGVY